MRSTIFAAFGACGLTLIAGLSACGNAPPDQQATVTQALAVACNVDGAVVPVAQPVVATLGHSGAAVAGVDSLLVHPAVVAACLQIGGTPAGVTPASPPVAASAAPTASGN
jgi:hypothetical protein